MNQLMPIGFTLEPRLQTFIVAKLNKKDAQQLLNKYKSLYPTYFQDYPHLKLILQKDGQLLMLFCLPEELDKMRMPDLEYIEMQLPAESPIDSRQKPLYEKYWNINHPLYEYPSKQIQWPIEFQTETNACVLYSEVSGIVAQADDESHINPIRHCVMVVMEKLAEYIVHHKQQYVATDLILFIDREPCIMCAMALVHSRIKAVYFNRFRDKDGGLNETLQINNMAQLNHRYLVFHK